MRLWSRWQMWIKSRRNFRNNNADVIRANVEGREVFQRWASGQLVDIGDVFK